MDLKYNEEPDPGFATGVRQLAWIDWTQDGVVLGRKAAGPCPVCGDRMAVYRRSVRWLRRAPAPQSRLITVRCNCRGTHEGRPATADGGCGQATSIDLAGWDPALGGSAP